ncbi:hypothetical protein An01g06740 [Aspergillus niger]|uniref:Uncharacterized protein n=2 Tax=Aspergillus niger TaxID=5061 RepID=A2Q958_ASPNC|nr:hypothetical protein An01g06740 [Aspergillus niger]CAK43792.1 hypothetical protein An01g06740 [Aspergillus niger]
MEYFILIYLLKNEFLQALVANNGLEIHSTYQYTLLQRGAKQLHQFALFLFFLCPTAKALAREWVDPNGLKYIRRVLSAPPRNKRVLTPDTTRRSPEIHRPNCLRRAFTWRARQRPLQERDENLAPTNRGIDHHTYSFRFSSATGVFYFLIP